MSFQWIVDKAEAISINNKKLVATTMSRNGVSRAVSRGNMPDVITVKLPDGIPWSWIKDDIASAETLDRITEADITINKDNILPWYGSPKTYTVRCIEFPEWTIFARNQVSWSGPFVFIEVI